MSSLSSISDIFNQRLFRVPDYQRGYSWTRKNLDDFWRDIEGLPEDHVHYMGAISVERPSLQQLERWSKESALFSRDAFTPSEHSALLSINGRQLWPYHIIDGQQRLLTIAILLSCIERCGYLQNQYASILRSQYLWIEDRSERCHYLGYEVDVPSHRFLIREIYNDEPSDEIATAYTRNLGRAKEYFNDKVLAYDMNEGKAEKLFKTLTQHLKFNFYEVDPSIDVCVVFETMNNRGKPLSRLELLKNRLLYLSTQLRDISNNDKPILREVINDGWKEIYAWLAKEEDKDPLDDDDFLRAHWIMYYEHGGETGKHIRTSDFADDLMVTRFSSSRARRGDLTKEAIQDYVNNLRESVKWWFAINYPSHPSISLGAGLRRWLNCIHEVKRNKSYFRPMMMGILQRDDLPDADKERLLQAIERFEFVVGHLAGARQSYGRPHFWRQANHIFSGEMDIDDVKQDIDRQKGKIYNQKKFIDQIESLYAKNPKEDGGWASWPAIRYFFREYNRHLNPEGDLPLPGQSIEHVFPKLALHRESWQKDFGNYSKDKQRKLCSTIGNLLLESRDRRSSRREDESADKHSFGAKRRYYEEGTASERELAKHSNWRRQEILERGIKLFEFMSSRWDVPLALDFRKQLTQVNFEQ
ncbi:MAG: DUF262 domain-containing protein [Phycisphaeraceae bacterium]